MNEFFYYLYGGKQVLSRCRLSLEGSVKSLGSGVDIECDEYKGSEGDKGGPENLLGIP
jgi:hypothetical protein